MNKSQIPNQSFELIVFVLEETIMCSHMSKTIGEMTVLIKHTDL